MCGACTILSRLRNHQEAQNRGLVTFRGHAGSFSPLKLSYQQWHICILAPVWHAYYTPSLVWQCCTFVLMQVCPFPPAFIYSLYSCMRQPQGVNVEAVGPLLIFLVSSSSPWAYKYHLTSGHLRRIQDSGKEKHAPFTWDSCLKVPVVYKTCTEHYKAIRLRSLGSQNTLIKLLLRR